MAQLVSMLFFGFSLWFLLMAVARTSDYRRLQRDISYMSTRNRQLKAENDWLQYGRRRDG